MIRLLALAAVAAAFVVAAAGCGGGSSDSSSGGTTTAAAGDGDTSGSSSGTSGGTTTVKTSNGSSSSTLAKSCLDFAGASAKIGQAIAASSSGAGDTGDLKAYFAALGNKAPSNLKSDFETLANAVGKYIVALKAAGFKPGETPSAAQIQKLQKAVAPLSAPGVQKASKEIQAWVDGGCKS